MEQFKKKNSTYNVDYVFIYIPFLWLNLIITEVVSKSKYMDRKRQGNKYDAYLFWWDLAS